MDIKHPLPIGTLVTYADLSPRENAVVFANDRTDPKFIQCVEDFNERLSPDNPVKIDEVDYCLIFPLDDYDRSPIPVQKDGIQLRAPETIPPFPGHGMDF